MTAATLHQLTLIAAQLEAIRVSQSTKRYLIADGRLSTATVHHVWHAHDHKISTLVAIADALGCEVEITIRPRSLNQTRTG